MYWGDQPGKNQGDDYNHSTLIDLILTGLFGIRPQLGRTLVVDPLLPTSVFKSFTVSRAIIAGIWVAFFQRVPATIVRTGGACPVQGEGRGGEVGRRGRAAGLPGWEARSAPAGARKA